MREAPSLLRTPPGPPQPPLTHPWGACGLFEDPGALVEAARRLRGRGPLEAYAPHEVHGLQEALGRKAPPLAAMVLGMAILGAAAGFMLAWWTTAIGYPLKVGGKPEGSWVPLLPVVFEVTVLFAAGTAALGMLFVLCGLPAFGHPMLATRAMTAITRDRYALSLEGDPGACAQALREAGATGVEAVHLACHAPMPMITLAAAGAGAALAGLLAFTLVKAYPELRPMVRMERQPRVGPQAPSRFFADGRAMRLPVAGTVARGHMPSGATTEAEAQHHLNPLVPTPAVLAEGRAAFTERCAVCHGALGDGRGSLGRAYGAAPADLHTDRLRSVPDGHLWWVIRKGRNAMPGHEADLEGTRVWALVHYVRALQRSRHALDSDLPEGNP